jgi:hypothetical protein
MIALAGTAEGNVAFYPETAPPAAVDDPAGWKLDLGNARFEELENFVPSIQVVTLLVSEDASELQIWLNGPEGAIFRWAAGPVAAYSGTLCFQFALTDGDEALGLDPGAEYELTMAILDDAGKPVVSKRVAVAGRAPSDLEGAPPTGESRVARVALACPRAPL